MSTRIEQLVGFSTPAPLPDPTDTRDERNWFVRVASHLPAAWDHRAASVLIEARATDAVRAACVARTLPDELAHSHAPRVKVFRIDESHLLLRIVTIRLKQDLAHTYLVAASSALRTLNEMISLDDIQGIPRRYWRLLLNSGTDSDPANE